MRRQWCDRLRQARLDCGGKEGQGCALTRGAGRGGRTGLAHWRQKDRLHAMWRCVYEGLGATVLFHHTHQLCSCAERRPHRAASISDAHAASPRHPRHPSAQPQRRKTNEGDRSRRVVTGGRAIRASHSAEERGQTNGCLERRHRVACDPSASRLFRLSAALESTSVTFADQPIVFRRERGRSSPPATFSSRPTLPTPRHVFGDA